MRTTELVVRGAQDLPAAVDAVRGACARASLDGRSATEFAAAVRRLVEHLLVGPERSGTLCVTHVCLAGRVGVHAEARVVCEDWGVDVPPIEDLVDELDAGFTADGAVRVWARKYRRVSTRGASRGQRAALWPRTQAC